MYCNLSQVGLLSPSVHWLSLFIKRPVRRACAVCVSAACLPSEFSSRKEIQASPVSLLTKPVSKLILSVLFVFFGFFSSPAVHLNLLFNPGLNRRIVMIASGSNV
ncbi:hypothetical protein ILYODFUR_028700 [Ilyodon furcidens]|uniref:Uncharacterized protein n=1 Tax=Ilyodon furcidens TaxID=33524 RepID=A0ABV0TBV1_9TELE